MKLFSAIVLLALFPKAAEGQSCSFSRNFGNGNALSTSGLEAFNAARGSTTTCTLSCDGGAATTLWIKYDETPNVFDQDGSSFDADGCSATISISSGSNEYRLGYVVNSANYNNLALSCSCSAVGPNEPNTCFSASSTVWTRDRGAVKMKDLQAGEKVLVGHNSNHKPVFEPVYSFGHIDETSEATFLKLTTNLTTSLEISESHLIYKLDGGRPAVARADSLKVSDELLWNGAAAQVERIESVVKQGLYMPLTPSGSILVDGIKASTYVSIQEWAPSLVQTLSMLGFSEQTVFHWWLAPYRFACIGLSKRLCGLVQRDEDGILNYLIQGKKLSQFAEGYGPLTRVLLFGPPLLLLFGPMVLLEYAFGPTMSAFLLALGFFWYVMSLVKEEDRAKKTV